MEWEDSRAEFFQETYPSDRSVSESIGLTSASNTGRRTVLESGVGGGGGTGSRNNHANNTLESRISKISRQSRHSNNGAVAANNKTPPTTSTTPADAISPTIEEAAAIVPLVTTTAVSLTTTATTTTTNVPVATKRNRDKTKTRMRAAVQGLDEVESDDGDIEVVDFNDENLATEVESWKNMKKLRNMPIPLSQKKTLRSQYQKCPKIKLQKRIAIGFACSKLGHGLGRFWDKLTRSLTSWSRPMVSVDKHRGSEMFAALGLHKLVILLTGLLVFTVSTLLLLPYIVFICDEPCQRLAQLVSPKNNTYYNNTYYYLLDENLLVDQFPLCYSFFQPGSSSSVKNGGLLEHIYILHLPLIYICVVIVCEVGVAIYLFQRCMCLMKGVVADEASDTWFKSLFASWNYSTVCKTSCLLKHQSIYRHIKHKIREAKVQQKPTCCASCLAITARILAFLATLLLWSAIVVLVHYATTDKGRDYFKWALPNQYQTVMVLLPSLLVTLTCKLMLPTLSGLLGSLEHYNFTVQAAVYTCRLFVGRAAALLTLVTTLYHQAASQVEVVCWEDRVCQQLLLLVLMDLCAEILLIVFLRFPRVLLTSMVRQAWDCTTKINYDPYEAVADLVWDLGLLCLSLLYCPLAPVFVFCKLCLSYSLKMFHVWVNCSASRDIHSPSCLRFLFVAFSSVMVLFATVALTFAITYNPVSKTCGVFADGQPRIVDTFSNELHGLFPANTSSTPYTVQGTVVTYLLVSSVCVLLFGLYVSHLKRLSIERNANELKCQLAITTQEKCYLISKIKKSSSKKPD